MSTILQTNQKVILSRRALVIGVITLAGIALAAVCTSIITAQTIASPGLRILDFFWRALSWLKV